MGVVLCHKIVWVGIGRRAMMLCAYFASHWRCDTDSVVVLTCTGSTSRPEELRWAADYYSIVSLVCLTDRFIGLRTISASFSASSRRTTASNLVHHLATRCSGLTGWAGTDSVICISIKQSINHPSAAATAAECELRKMMNYLFAISKFN